jgi:flagellar motor switch protein FliN
MSEDKPLDQAAIDALLKTTGKSGRPSRGSSRKGGAPAQPPTPPILPDTGGPGGGDGDDEGEGGLTPLPRARAASPGEVYATIAQVPVEIAVVLGDLEMPIAEVLKLKPGSVVQLDAWVDAPVEIRMRGRTVARAQIVTLEDTYALRIVENLIAAPDFPPAGSGA